MFSSLQNLILVVILFCISTTVGEASAQVHRLRERGKVLVEGESFSAVSDSGPKSQVDELCSGDQTLAYFWDKQWFEIRIDAPKMLNYTLSLRAASEFGSQLKIIAVDASEAETLLAKVSVPKTGSWTKYVNTKDVTISIPAGIQTLRIINLREGVNVDYINFTAGDHDDVVSRKLTANSGPDINPMKGFNSGGWRPDDDYASVGFQYIEWGKFEPKDDEFDWEYVEEVLNREGSKGRHFILQFVIDWDAWGLQEPQGDSHYKGPKWLLDQVGEEQGPADVDDPESRITRATRYNNPVFIEEATEAINALVEHYRDDPRAFVMQAGLLGYWGEWHTFPREDWSPNKATKFAILDAYSKSLGSGGLTQVRYPNEPVAEPRVGMGYTNGSATLTKHGFEFGAAIAKGQLWKNGPVSGKWPPNVELEQFEKFFLTEDGLAFIEQGHYSTILVPEAKEIVEKLPGWTKNGLFMKMHRRMGYNFQASSVKHLVSAGDTKQTHIEVDLVNFGISPFYKDWNVQLAILESATGKVLEMIELDVDLRELGPGETIHMAGTINASIEPNREYQIGLRILQPQADRTKPVAWKLKQRNTYIVLANDVQVIDGKWSKKNALEGGWNILDTVRRRQANQPKSLDRDSYPLRGSFRPNRQ